MWCLICPCSVSGATRRSACPFLITEKTTEPDAPGPSRSWRTNQPGARTVWAYPARKKKMHLLVPKHVTHPLRGAAHMWRDHQSFQVINPWLSGWPEGEEAARQAGFCRERRVQSLWTWDEMRSTITQLLVWLLEIGIIYHRSGAVWEWTQVKHWKQVLAIIGFLYANVPLLISIMSLFSCKWPQCLFIYS